MLLNNPKLIIHVRHFLSIATW